MYDYVCGMVHDKFSRNSLQTSWIVSCGSTTAFQIVMVAPMVGWVGCRMVIGHSVPFDQGLQRCLQRARRYLDGAVGDGKSAEVI